MFIVGLDRFGQFHEIVAAHERGEIPSTVAWGACPSLFDPSQAPPGRHVAFLWEKVHSALRARHIIGGGEEMHGRVCSRLDGVCAEPCCRRARIIFRNLSYRANVEDMARGYCGCQSRMVKSAGTAVRRCGNYRNLCGSIGAGAKRSGGNITGCWLQPLARHCRDLVKDLEEPPERSRRSCAHVRRWPANVRRRAGSSRLLGFAINTAVKRAERSPRVLVSSAHRNLR